MNTDTEQTAEEVFRLLSDETRLDILRTVARAQHDGEFEMATELSFSEIYDRVSVDNSSKLSYHLNELTGTFLRKHQNGYAFTHAGERLTRFVLAGNYRQPQEIDPIEVDVGCVHCTETGLQATCREQYFMIVCPACERPNFSLQVTPAQVQAHEGDVLLDAITWELVGDILKMRQGVCPSCGGSIATEVLDTSEGSDEERAPGSFATCSVCEQCLLPMNVPLPHAVVYHPESVAFHWDHGVDIMEADPWEFHEYLRDGTWSAARTGTEPDEYCVELRVDTGSLRLFLDGSATVTRTERVKRRDQSDRRIG
jgi:hypothetical protein